MGETNDRDTFLDGDDTPFDRDKLDRDRLTHGADSPQRFERLTESDRRRRDGQD